MLKATKTAMLPTTMRIRRIHKKANCSVYNNNIVSGQKEKKKKNYPATRKIQQPQQQKQKQSDCCCQIIISIVVSIPHQELLLLVEKLSLFFCVCVCCIICDPPTRWRIYYKTKKLSMLRVCIWTDVVPFAAKDSSVVGPTLSD